MVAQYRTFYSEQEDMYMQFDQPFTRQRTLLITHLQEKDQQQVFLEVFITRVNTNSLKERQYRHADNKIWSILGGRAGGSGRRGNVIYPALILCCT